MNIDIENGNTTTYRINMVITFVLDDGGQI
jgi:hypothetical protein